MRSTFNKTFSGLEPKTKPKEENKYKFLESNYGTEQPKGKSLKPRVFMGNRMSEASNDTKVENKFYDTFSEL